MCLRLVDHLLAAPSGPGGVLHSFIKVRINYTCPCLVCSFFAS